MTTPTATATAEADESGERRAPLRFLVAGFGPDAVDYAAGWRLQRDLHASRVDETGNDVVVLLEHLSVYTAGKRTQPPDRPVDGTPVIEVDRGGKITWHGPGQLVGYPIVKLPGHIYVVDYVRRLEEALIRVCAALGLTTGRVWGRSGVWVPADSTGPERKVAAVGVRVSGGVTMHGFALNCANSLQPYDAIVPCGITDASVTTLSLELGREVGVRDVVPLVQQQLSRLLDWTPYTRSPDLVRAERLQAGRSDVAPGSPPVNA